MSVASTFFLAIFCFAFAAWTSAAHADEIEIVDTRGVLKSLRGTGTAVEFTDAFTCNQPTAFFVTTGRCRVHCEYGLCHQQCSWPQVVQTQFQPEDCQADHVSIFSTLGHSINVTANDYQASSNSLALTLIKSVSLFYDSIGKIEIELVSPLEKRKMIENGQLKDVFLTTLFISLFPDRNRPESFGLSLSLDLQRTGLDQLMCLAENDTCKVNTGYFIKRKGLLRD